MQHGAEQAGARGRAGDEGKAETPSGASCRYPADDDQQGVAHAVEEADHRRAPGFVERCKRDRERQREHHDLQDRPFRGSGEGIGGNERADEVADAGDRPANAGRINRGKAGADRARRLRRQWVDARAARASAARRARPTTHRARRTRPARAPSAALRRERGAADDALDEQGDDSGMTTIFSASSHKPPTVPATAESSAANDVPTLKPPHSSPATSAMTVIQAPAPNRVRMDALAALNAASGTCR